jgi:NAD(P)-dependent dehydrogenase (short-subunit alcohol dehydrogenase family)
MAHTTPTEELLGLDILQPENIRDTLHAYQLAKRCNEKRVMAQAVEWGKRGARLNDIASGIIVTPLAIDEFNGPRGDFYKRRGYAWKINFSQISRIILDLGVCVFL